MAIFFDPEICGFLMTEFGSVIPPGAVEISDEDHRNLLDGQANGMRIVAGADGRPILMQTQAERVTIVPGSVLRARFTTDELKAARRAGMRQLMEQDEAGIQVFMDDLASNTPVDMATPETRANMEALRDAGALSQSRLDELLSI